VYDIFTPFPAFPHGGRGRSNLSPLREIRKGVDQMKQKSGDEINLLLTNNNKIY
jgi:hypothetical protein